MFRTVIDEPTGSRVVAFSFRHLHGPLGSRATICTIYNEAKEPMVEGVSNCCSMDVDRFNKNYGRKLALARALARLNISKENRAKVWTTYLNRPRINVSNKVVPEGYPV